MPFHYHFWDKTYYVYIVICLDGNFYTGITWNIGRRVQQHNGKGIGGARYTSIHGPVSLVHIEKFDSRKKAHARELKIKDMSHLEKKELIEKTTKSQILSAI